MLEYYHRLEAGLLDPTRIDRRVFAAIARALRAGLADLAFAAPPQAAGGLYLRSPPAAPARIPADAVLSRSAPVERDEVDELFGG